jgi:hydrogenase maturation protease
VPEASILVIGYGNPGRQDDGLGPAAIEAIDAMNLPGIETSSNYQLMIEDASDIAVCAGVVFIDASKTGDEPYTVAPVVPAINVSCFASHVVPPELVMGLCREIYGRSPPAHLVGIRGYEFAFSEGLTGGARANLAFAVARLRVLLDGSPVFS